MKVKLGLDKVCNRQHTIIYEQESDYVIVVKKKVEVHTAFSN